MFRHNSLNTSLFRSTLLTILGLSLIVAAPLSTRAGEKMSKRAIKEMIGAAKTASDHQALADYYNAEAAKAQGKADEHAKMAEWYSKAGEGVKKIPYAPGTISHCDRLEKHYQAAAEDLRALAKEHETLSAKAK
ncbi:MAG: hypothetical protein AB1898_08000 [Acidobacteriota bacterium]